MRRFQDTVDRLKGIGRLLLKLFDHRIEKCGPLFGKVTLADDRDGFRQLFLNVFSGSSHQINDILFDMVSISDGNQIRRWIERWPIAFDEVLECDH